MPVKTKSELNSEILVSYSDFLKVECPEFGYIEGGNENLSNLTRLLHLSNGSGHSVAIIGAKGVGKKTLARALVHTQQDESTPSQLMMRPFYRLNVNALFNSSAPQQAEKKFNDVMKELKSIHDRRGVKPLLVIEDGTGFIKGVSGGAHGNIVHILDDADNGSNYLDILIVASEAAIKDLHESHPSFMADLSVFKLEEPGKGELLEVLRKHAEGYKASGIEFEDESLRKMIEVTTQYPKIFDYAQPKRAVRFMDEVAVGFQLTMHSRPQGYFDRLEQIENIEKKIAAESDSSEKESLIGMRDTLVIEQDQSMQEWTEARAAVRKLQGEIKNFEEMIHDETVSIGKMEAEDRKRFEGEAEGARDVLVEMAEKGDPTAKGIPADRFRAMDSDAILKFADFDKNLHQNPRIREGKQSIARYERSIGKMVEKVGEKSEILGFSVCVPPTYVEDLAKQLTKTEINPHMLDAMADSERLLGEVVLNQEGMNRKISSSLKIAAAGGNNPDKPIGVFLILGPSGVGKTFVAETLSELIYGSKEKFLSTFNMENYQQSQNVSSLIGAPPGLVGYGERGLLIAAAQDRPYSVVLLDEIEKAHKDIKQTMLTALDKGQITGQDGEVGDLRNTIIVMTSNYGQDVFLDPSLSQEEAQKVVKERIYRDGTFSPEFLNRTQIVFANFLPEEAIVSIAQREAVKLEKRYKAKNPDLKITLSKEDAEAIVSELYSKEQGARVVKNIVETEVGVAVAERIFAERKKTGKPVAGELTAKYSKESGFSYEFSAKGESSAPTLEKKPQVVAVQAFSGAAPA